MCNASARLSPRFYQNHHKVRVRPISNEVNIAPTIASLLAAACTSITNRWYRSHHAQHHPCRCNASVCPCPHQPLITMSQQQHAGLHKKTFMYVRSLWGSVAEVLSSHASCHGRSVWHGLQFQPRPPLRRALQARYHLQAAQSWQLRVCTRSTRAPSPE